MHMWWVGGGGGEDHDHGHLEDIDFVITYCFPDNVSPTPEESSGLQFVGSGKLLSDKSAVWENIHNLPPMDWHWKL